MARTISTIHSELKANFMDNSKLQEKYSFDSDETFDNQFSNVSIENLFLYIVALSIYILEQLYDDHKSDVETTLSNMRPHSLKWYVEKAKAFQFGDEYNLVDGTDYYTKEDEDAQIVAYAAAAEKNGTLLLKVAKKNTDGNLEPLSKVSTGEQDNEFTPFKEYISRVKDAGVKVDVISDVGDDLNISIDIWYDPLVLNKNGELLDGSGVKPAEVTIKEFIISLPFNGEFVLAKLVEALVNTQGIDFPVIHSIQQSKYDANDWTDVTGKVVPYAGYFNILEKNFNINYKANV
jgi:hypothetical protein